MATGVTGSSHDRARGYFHVTVVLDAATCVDRDLWICNRPAILRSFSESHATASTSGTYRPRKITDTSAPGAAASSTVIELAASQSNAGTANTVTTVSGSSITGGNDGKLFKVGNRLAIDGGGTQTNLVGMVLTFTFQAI